MSKGNIDRLGDQIREESIAISESTLNTLQKYRISHKEPLANTFNLLCACTKKVNKNSIVTFRIKRFQSIIRKLERYPKMRFNRMWDIAGCRCIVNNESDVYKLRELIYKEPRLEVLKEYDYLKEPQEDGYKSLHLFLKHDCDDKIIEVQLRSLENHNWATLVEITDLLYDSKLKEYGENKELLRFHLLLSDVKTLDIYRKYELAHILNKFEYFDKLSEVFSRNYLKVRKQWFDLETKVNHKYFLIEANRNEVPIITSFPNFQQAEENYFEIYKIRPNANIVLTHLQNANYNQISIAYSNYILTFHSFLSECFDLLESLLIESIDSRKPYSFYKVLYLYNGLVFNHIRNLVSEINEVQDSTMPNKLTRNNRKKGMEWRDDIQKQINKSNRRGQELQKALQYRLEGSSVRTYINKTIIRIINKKYKKRIEKVLATTQGKKEKRAD